MTVEEVEVPQVKEGEVLVKLHAAALNHREVFVRQCELLVSRGRFPATLTKLTM